MSEVTLMVGVRAEDYLKPTIKQIKIKKSIVLGANIYYLHDSQGEPALETKEVELLKFGVLEYDLDWYQDWFKEEHGLDLHVSYYAPKGGVLNGILGVTLAELSDDYSGTTVRVQRPRFGGYDIMELAAKHRQAKSKLYHAGINSEVWLYLVHS